MLDTDLADLYAVETKQLKRTVRRNISRFPEDFMFELTLAEFEYLRCQIGTSSWDSIRYAPMAFTEHGVVMFASVLNSERAIEINIRIIGSVAFDLTYGFLIKPQTSQNHKPLIFNRIFFD